MAKIKWSDEKVVERIKQGYGSGSGMDYKPWIHVVNGPTSKSFAQRPKGWKTNRKHQLLSILEFHTFLFFEWEEAVIDIREQYPLNRTKTEVIAEKLGIKHPNFDRRNTKDKQQVLSVMTTDFLLSVKNNDEIGYIAIAVKPSEELDKKRTIEKLEIEKTYWEEKNIKWGIFTEKDLNDNFINNLKFIHNHKGPLPQFERKYFDNLSAKLVKGIHENSDQVFQYFFDNFDGTFNLEEGTAISLFRYCLANKFIMTDMLKPIDFSSKIKDLIVANEGNKKEGVLV
ncbi:heteromeric transposase endonuclease subunit TnsA [Siminovitchia acidinfaciens]|uniref:Heteromeric transposase endonuclease subunit TnsA n=1 Tax=Siminovitchia acidinfaciens TaxID=2321395 RepID=A0A429Y415_9BACI|nr:TnsA endonuclease N-terminal domain-containing protein [Siminovitchia acidinfaciens]RST76165.1 heteromeric transposase endonuclease subunit TnsA [Siminovitchia acidinfaciens]